MKTEQATTGYAQWDGWTSYDVIKHHMITTDKLLHHIQILTKTNPHLSTEARMNLNHCAN